MIKKIITTTTILAASVALANAACVAYTFSNTSNTQATGATNISVTGGPSSIDATKTKLSETFLGNASLTITAEGGQKKLFANSQNSIIGSDIGDTGRSLLTSANPALTGGVSGITYGLHNGAAGAAASVVFTATGLAASTDYTITMIVKPASTSSAISWTGGNLVSGSYVVGSGSTATTISTGTSVTIGSTTETAVSLKLTTDANGGFTITFPNIDGAKTEIGYFAISGPTVPEPSAFSLLAGLGALALTVSRRRRKN